MTVLAAAIGDDGTWVASDGLETVGSRAVSTSATKWYFSPQGDWAFASDGAATAPEICSRSLIWPTKCGEDGLSELMKSMREVIEKDRRFQQVYDEGEAFGDFRFSPLIATAGSVWRLDSSLAGFVAGHKAKMIASGCGVEFAYGAMTALYELGEKSAEKLVRFAVTAACEHNVFCGGEIFVRRVNEK